MIKVTLKDGSVREFNDNTDVISIAKDISEGLARNVISAKFNNQTVETQSSLNSDGNIIYFRLFLELLARPSDFSKLIKINKLYSKSIKKLEKVAKKFFLEN